MVTGESIFVTLLAFVQIGIILAILVGVFFVGNTLRPEGRIRNLIALIITAITLFFADAFISSTIKGDKLSEQMIDGAPSAFFIKLNEFLIKINDYCPYLRIRGSFLLTLIIGVLLVFIWSIIMFHFSDARDDITDIDNQTRREIEERNRTKERVGHFEFTTRANHLTNSLHTTGKYVDDTEYEFFVPLVAIFAITTIVAFIFLPTMAFFAVLIPYIIGIIRG